MQQLMVAMTTAANDTAVIVVLGTFTEVYRILNRERLTIAGPSCLPPSDIYVPDFNK